MKLIPTVTGLCGGISGSCDDPYWQNNNFGDWDVDLQAKTLLKKKMTIDIKSMSAGTHGEAQLSYNNFMSQVITEIVGIPMYPFSFEVYYFLKIPRKNP